MLAAGHVSIRVATMERGKRYKIDVRDPAHPVILLNEARPLRDLVEAIPAIETRLAAWHATRKRVPLVPVAELEGDESLLAAAATGTEHGASDLAARQARRTFGVVHGDG